MKKNFLIFVKSQLSTSQILGWWWVLLRTAYLTLSQISQIRNLSLFPPRQSLLLPTYCLYLKHSESLTKRKHSLKRTVKVKHISTKHTAYKIQ